MRVVPVGLADMSRPLAVRLIMSRPISGQSRKVVGGGVICGGWWETRGHNGSERQCGRGQAR